MNFLKKLLIGTVMSLFAFAMIGCPAKADSSGEQTMYRFYNRTSGEHLYTADMAEAQNLVNIGWVYEGVAWVAPTMSDTPVYRVYNPNNGDHHYTTDKYEISELVKKGWRDEGIKWYSDDSKERPVYCAFNKNAKTGSHNYTTDKNEQNTLAKLGWIDEGVKWYAYNKTVEADPIVPNNLGTEFASIEGDMNLTGTGTGYHAKLLIYGNYGRSASSFGIQYDTASALSGGAYRNKGAYMSERVNLGTNQIYRAYAAAPIGKNAHVKLSYFKGSDKGNMVAYYVNGICQGWDSTDMEPYVDSQGRTVMAFGVEGSARKVNDSINAQFYNIKVSGAGVVPKENDGWNSNWNDTSNNHYNLYAKWDRTNTPDPFNANISVTGTLANFPPDLDWDTYWKIPNGAPPSGVAQITVKVAS